LKIISAIVDVRLK